METALTTYVKERFVGLVEERVITIFGMMATQLKFQQPAIADAIIAIREDRQLIDSTLINAVRLSVVPDELLIKYLQCSLLIEDLDEYLLSVAHIYDDKWGPIWAGMMIGMFYRINSNHGITPNTIRIQLNELLRPLKGF